ncbi:fumarylacetoacetate hydrolase family protein [Bradyrhizobium sp. RDT10]
MDPRASEIFDLMPGDVIATGTPAGIGFTRKAAMRQRSDGLHQGRRKSRSSGDPRSAGQAEVSAARTSAPGPA